MKENGKEIALPDIKTRHKLLCLKHLGAAPEKADRSIKAKAEARNKPKGQANLVQIKDGILNQWVLAESCNK